MTMKLKEVLNRVIDDGLAEVKTVYPEDGDSRTKAKRAGSIRGFEACRNLSEEELLKLAQQASEQARRKMGSQVSMKTSKRADNLDEYWSERYRELQIAFVINVLNCALLLQQQEPFSPASMTARGLNKAKSILEGSNAK